LAAGPPEGLSFTRIAYRQLVRNRLAMVGFAMVVFVATVAALVPFLANDKPYVIYTTLTDDYDEAFASWFDAHLQMKLLLGQAQQASTQPDPMRLALQVQSLSRNLERMASQLSAGDREQLRRFAERYRVLLSAPVFVEQAWDSLASQFASKFKTDVARLVPHYYFPLFRALRPVEIFFLILYIGSVAQWVIRRRSSPTWRRAGLLALVAAVAAIAEGFAFPPKAVPAGYFKKLVPNAGLALFPPVPYGETESIIDDMKQPPTWLVPAARRGPNLHILGTDIIGRDVLSRMIYGSRIAMVIGFVAVSIYVTIGIIAGACAGFFRGRIDMAISRLIEVVICFPILFLILIVLVYLPPSILNIMVVIGLTSWTGVARLTRGEFLRIVNLDYVSAIQALGGSNWRIIFRHILPNGIGPVLVVASFGIASAILIESALSFLGMGVPPPHASWGTLLYDGREDIQGAWWLTVFPGFAIFMTVTAWNLFGEGLRDAIDPRLKQ
jgi:peptide/nickel transport system permease protein